MGEPALTRMARFVAEAPLDADTDCVSMLRNGVIDTLGCIHAGATTQVARSAQDGVRSMGAAGTSPVLGVDMRTSKPQAAFLNAIAGHALDYDDWEILGNSHPTVVLLPALLACAGPDTSGAALASAYLAGFEVIARLGEALNFEHYDRGWHTTVTFGALGAAAAVARLLKLPGDKTANAMSLAASAATGFTSQFGSNAKAMQAGFASRAGVEAACLAQAGITAQSHILDHPRGFGALLSDAAPERLSAAADRMGGSLALAEHGLVLKPWPSCGYTHRIMTCALDARGEVDLDAIERVDVHLPDFHAAVLPFLKPQTQPEALFSLPFVATMGLVKGQLTLDDINRGVWTDTTIVAFMERVHVDPFKPERPDLNYAPEDPDRLVVTLSGGRQVEVSCTYPIGAPQRPMSDAQLWDKFNENTGLESGNWQTQLSDWTDQTNVVELMTGRGTLQ